MRATGKQELGRAGEDLAARWYVEHGYEVVDRNWRCSTGELDIVARRGRLTVFCEVKTRSSNAFGTPAEAVGALKRLRGRRSAAAWFAARATAGAGGAGGAVRFDVACVMGRSVTVIEDAF